MDVLESQTAIGVSPVTFREKLNDLRKAKGWSVKTLAVQAGLRFGTVNGYCISGKNNKLPNLKNAFRLAKALGVSLEVFSDCSDWTIPDKDSTSDDVG